MAVTRTFGTAGGGNWVSANWLNAGTTGLPVAGDSMLIDIANTVTQSTFPPTGLDVLTINNGSAVLLLNTGGSNLSLTSATTSGLSLLAGAVTLSAASNVTLTARNLTATGGSIVDGSHGIINVLPSASAGGVLSLTSATLSLSTLGQLNLGATTGALAGLVNINAGGVASILSGSSLTANSFTLAGGTFTQAAGGVSIAANASLGSGTFTMSGGLFQAGTVNVGTAITVNGGTIQALASGGGIVVASAKVVTLGGGTLDAGTNSLAVANSGTLSGKGSVTGNISGTGSIKASGGTLDLAGSVASTQTMSIDTGSASDLKLDGTFSTGTISLTGTNQTLEIGTTGSVSITAAQTVALATLQIDASGSLVDSSGLSVTTGVLSAAGIVNVAGSTFTLSGGSATVASGGQLNIGTATGAAGGEALITSTGIGTFSGGSLQATTFKVTGGTFNQSAGTITNSGTATFSGGTDTMSGGLFSAGSVVVGTAFSLNGGTLQSTSSGISVSSGTVLTMAGGTLDGTTGGIADNGTITGKGTILGALSGTGSVVATGGVLEINNNVAAASGLNFTIGSAAGSVLKIDGTEASGQNVTFASTTAGVLELNGATAVGGLSDSIANLGTDSSATSVSGVDFINLQGVSVTSVKIGGVLTNVFNGVANTVTLFNGATQLGILNFASAPTNGTNFDWAADSSANGNALGGTDLFLSSVVCFAAGTAIATDSGEVPVEALAEGDMVVTVQDGQPVPMPVKWMGIRKIDIAGHPHPHTVAPIRIRAGAFGDDLPRRDLLVSPAHAIYVDGKLVPANLLINHMTIMQDLHTQSVTYYHIEMDRHSLILAEGLTSESYLDTGNRAYFSNAGMAMVLHPEFHVNAGLKQWEEDACAPLAIDAETIAPIWQTLADRAETLGYVPPRFTTTTDADMYVEANGRRLRPIAVAQGRHTFMLPAGANDIVLRSRTSAPADLNPLSGDWRSLGVAVRGMTLRDGDDHIVIPADHPGLIQGWHTAEAINGSVWRWTTGNAAIPIPGTAGPAMLDIEIGAMATYILTRSDQEAQRLAA